MTLLNELLGTKYPIIQGGMANIAMGRFAAACACAGALGLIGTGGIHSAEELRTEIRTARKLIEEAATPDYEPVFGVNLMLMNPCTEAFVQVCIEEKVPVVTTGAGNPGQYMALRRPASR